MNKQMLSVSTLAIVTLVLTSASIMEKDVANAQQTATTLPPTNNQRQPANCSNIAEVLEKCGANSSYSHTIPGSFYPTTLDELKVSCPKIQDGLGCIRRHLKCLHPLSRRAMLAFIDSRRKHHKSVCGNLKSQEAQDFVAAYRCISKHKLRQSRDQEISSIKQMDAIISSQVTEFKERFQRSCCAIVDYRRRTINDLKPECSNQAFVNQVESFIDSVVGQAVEFACPDTKSGICESYKPLKLAPGPVNKTLTRAGTDLMMVITAPDDKDSKPNSHK